MILINALTISKISLTRGFLLVFVLGAAALMPLSGTVSGLSPISTALAQTAGCDDDGDGYIKDSGKCRAKNKWFPIDCDDSNPDLNDNCELDPPPAVELKTLEVTVRFGHQDSNFESCSAPSCVETTFTVTGTVECGSIVCDFIGTEIVETSSEDPPVLLPPPPFAIAPSLFNLLAMTSIRQTQIVPELCYDILGGFPQSPPPDGIDPFNSYSEAGTTIEGINTFELRSPIDPQPDDFWRVKVWAMSDDMAGIPQQYGFHFGGQCDRMNGYCPALTDDTVVGEYENGIVDAVFGSGTGRPRDPQTCRCTVSSKPSCPAHVDMGDLARPAAQVFVQEPVE